VAVRLGNHLRKGATGPVSDQRYGVPLLTRFGRQGFLAVAGVEDLCAMPLDQRAYHVDVLEISLASAIWLETKQVEHNDGLAIVF